MKPVSTITLILSLVITACDVGALLGENDRTRGLSSWPELTPELVKECPGEENSVDLQACDMRRAKAINEIYTQWEELELAEVHALLGRGADPNYKDFLNLTPLHWAASENKNPAVVEALLDAGADVDAKNGSGYTPLHEAAGSNENPAIVEALLDAGADINAKTGSGSTPLHEAAGWNKTPAVVEALLAAGAEVNARDEDGNTPLYKAAERRFFSTGGAGTGVGSYGVGCYEGVDGNLADDEVQAMNEHRQVVKKVVKVLLDAGADPNAANNRGITPLMWVLADHSGLNAIIIPVLLDNGAEVTEEIWGQANGCRRELGDELYLRMEALRTAEG